MGGRPAPKEDAQAAHLQTLYAARFDERERAFKRAIWVEIFDHFLVRYVAPDATVLDIGAGYCDLINAVRAEKRIAVDMNPDTKTSAAPGVEVFGCELTEMARHVPRRSVDVAFASNVFEHLRSPTHLLEVLAAVREVLKPGGKLVVIQPNISAVGAAFWDYFDHTLPLTDKGMAEALTSAGFRVLEQRPRFLPYTVRSRMPKAPWMVRAYLKLPIAHRLLGKQMLVVAQAG